MLIVTAGPTPWLHSAHTHQKADLHLASPPAERADLQIAPRASTVNRDKETTKRPKQRRRIGCKRSHLTSNG
ncbi:hypothetical protein CesoFtcFv8_025302 [Champsocephalus esox]|uniref:Uncharacterized protein n=1 Tax=Champsocephalus esox TaxID=159716 RepID=A0AAN8B465_9TELE|nr:hypothetical protein CesoFtcFv8_025302 [Champsocephalus esox]